MYSSTSSTPDLTKPTAPSAFANGTITSNSVGFGWTFGGDAATGVQATIILRTTNTSAATPVLNDQGVYSVAGGTNGPNTVGADWTVLSVSVPGATLNYTDNTVSPSTSYKYAVIHRDGAYNYSNTLVSGTITTPGSGIPDILLSSPNPAIASSNIAQGSTNNPIYRFDLAVATATAALNGVTINTTGSYTASDITNLKCWYSADNTFNAGSDILLSTKSTVLSAGSHIFPSFTSQIINSGTTGYVFITTDVACGSVLSNTISVDAITTADISFVNGNKTGSAFAGGTQTVVTGTLNNATGAGATNGNSQSSVSWINPTSCYDEIMIVAADGAANSGTPTGDGTAYTANLANGSGTALGNGFVVYKGITSPQIVTALTNGNTYYFKIFTRSGTTWSSGVEVSTTPAAASSATDYFRSAVSTGNWIAIGSWESSADGVSNWIAATLTPTSASSGVTIRNGHTITLTATETVDQCTVDAGGQLTIAGGVAWTLGEGAGTDFTVNGTVLNQGGTWTITGGATWTVNSGGVYIHNTTSGASTPLGAATLDPNSTIIYRGSSSLTPAISYSGRTFGHLVFESSSGTWLTSPTLIGTGASSCTNYTVGSGVTLTLTYTGIFTINGNFTNNGTITYSTGTQTYTFTGANKSISGTGTIAFEALNINTGASITANNAVAVLATFTATITGTFATAATYTNSGTTNVNGTFQINQGGWATGNNFVYGASGSLVFNNTSGVYGVNNTDVFFPSTNGPVNLSVLNGASAGVNFNSITRTVSGTFTYAAPISNYCNLTFSGSKIMSYGAQLTCGTFTYSSCLNTLTYNSGANPHARGNEWTNANTPGIVTVTNNSVISFPGYGNGTICGDLNIGSGSALYADYGGGSASLTVGGNLVLDGNLSLGGAFGGDLYVKGNWTKAVAATFTPNNRTVFFDGTTGDQTITGATTFDYVILDKAAGNLLLASPISLNQTLTLTNGKVVLGANDLSILNAAPSSLSGGSATSYVVTNGAGALRRAIGTLYNGDYFFPVGNTSNRQLATVNFGSISANNTLAARFITGASGNAGLPLTEGENIARTASDGYWEINAASATGDTYTGTFVANGFTDITDFTKVHLLKRADAVSAWTLNGTHVTTTGSNALASLQRTGMSGFSQFAVGGESLISLPSVMLSFSGYKSGSVNKLNWTTVSEQNNRGFAVERSADGVNYAAIGFVNSLAVNGNSDASLTYSFTDVTPTGSKQYYRLRQQDINGVSRLSNVIVIKGEKVNTLTIDGLYPNPVSSQLNVAVSSPVRGTVNLQVVDMTGRILSQHVRAIAEGSNTVSVNVAGLSNGSYILKVVNAETGAVSAKFSKQ